jgi:hypothetical protein
MELICLSCRGAANSGEQMPFLKLWIGAVQFGLEAQGVIAMRLINIAHGGQDGAAECTRIVLEKFEVAAPAHTARALTLARGGSEEATTKIAMVPVKRRVCANHLRLISSQTSARNQA